ncbi:hypothetical protein [Tsukamurella sp. 1534]|uniref:hypothetical protein n=1 Tax=Tsukamurella sp. 1534 TaxID=1151061 RepID=UPI00192AF931|nr:hypothetical protein [Tsukamurella sp. 1534]
MARLFDIRNIIAALLGLYGLALLVAGLLPGLAEAGAGAAEHTADVTDLAAGSSANLWVGAALVLVAAGFAGWAAARPAARDRPDRESE